MPQTILEMAKDLVMAQIQAGALPPDEMHKELQKTYASLVDLRIKEELGENGGGLAARGGEDLSLEGDVGPTALHWKKSIKKYTIECLVCGAAFKQLSVRHLIRSRCLRKTPRRCVKKLSNRAVPGKKPRHISKLRIARRVRVRPPKQ